MNSIIFCNFFILLFFFSSCQVSGQTNKDFKTTHNSTEHFKLFRGHIDHKPAIISKLGTGSGGATVFYYFLDEGSPFLQDGNVQIMAKDTDIYFRKKNLFEDMMVFSRPVIPTLLKDGYEYQWLIISPHESNPAENGYEFRGKLANDSLYEGFLGGENVPKNQWKPFSFSLDTSITDIKFELINFEKSTSTNRLRLFLLKPKHPVKGLFLENEILKISQLSDISSTIISNINTHKLFFDRYLLDIESGLNIKFKQDYIKFIDTHILISFIDSNIVSIIRQDDISNGDTRCWTNYNAYTYDLKTQSRIYFKDIFKINVEKNIRELLQEEASHLKFDLKITNLEHFYLTNKGLMFIYTNAKQFADCQDKYPIQLFLPFQKIKNLVNIKKVKQIIPLGSGL